MRFTSFIIAIALLISCKETAKKDSQGAAGNKSAPPTPSTYAAIVAETYPVNRVIEAPGTILPNEITDLQPEISGRVVAINFKEGSFVKTGTLLVKLFDADLQAQLKKLDVQLDVAEATAKRQKELLAINGTSQQDYDNAILNVSNIKADMDLLKVRISQTELRAPYDGKLGLRNISLGAYVTPATIITNIAQVNTIKVEFAVPEKYAYEMQPGKLVTLETADRNSKYSATIIASQNQIAAETRNLQVRAVIRNADARITPGSFVQVKIDAGAGSSGIMVPTEAVIPSTRNKKLIVMREGKAVFQTIETGFRDSARVEVFGGIRVGDTIVISGLLTIKDGMPIAVRIARP